MAEQGPAIADRTPIYALLGANAVSQVGNMITVLAVPWFVLETTGSAASVGLTAATVGVGAVVPAVLGGLSGNSSCSCSCSRASTRMGIRPDSP